MNIGAVAKSTISPPPDIKKSQTDSAISAAGAIRDWSSQGEEK
jgi:hypothetical protein